MHRYNKINNINNDLGWPFMLTKFLDPKNVYGTPQVVKKFFKL
jgi:hypothetical protein